MKGTWNVEMDGEKCRGTLKLIRKSKIGKSTRPFKNLFPKRRLRSARGVKSRKEACG